MKVAKYLSGKSVRDIAQSHPDAFIKFHTGIKELVRLNAPVPLLRRQVHVTVLWGRTGTGKTYRVTEKYSEAYMVEPGRDPWGSYNGEDVIVFDEFDPSKWSIQEMNRYLDIYRLQLNCRYNNKYAHWTRIYILSNSSPERWFYAFDSELQMAFLRRIHRVIEVSDINQVIEDL